MADTGSVRKYSAARGWLVVLAACLIMFTPTYAQMQMSPIAGQLMLNYGISDAQYMTVFTAPNIVPIVLSFIAGILLDRFGTKKTVLIAAVFTAIGTIARIYVVGYVPFYCATIMFGFATSFIVTGSTKLMARFFPIDKIGLPVGVLYASSSVAGLIAAATTAYFPDLTAAFIASAAVACVAVLAWAMLVPAETKEELEQDGESGEKPKIGGILKSVVSCRDLWFILLAFICVGVMGFTMGGILPTALATRGMSVEDAGLMAAVLQGGMLIGCVAMPPIVSRLKNEKPFLCVASVVMAVLFLGVMVVPLGAPLIIDLLILGVLSYGLTPIFMSLPIRYEKIGPERAGTAGGLMSCIQSLCIAVLPGYVFTPMAGGNYSIIFVILAVMAVIIFVCSLVIRIPKNVTPEN